MERECATFVAEREGGIPSGPLDPSGRNAVHFFFL